MSPIHVPTLIMGAAYYGSYGVDLFFVISGWLIGGLYWRETLKFGDVQLCRFWLRRWLRTIPPYLVALALAWLAVQWQRDERFDLGYLFFAQNYYGRIPFFTVSWSLCVEEHFYLFLPLLLLVAVRLPRALIAAAFCCLMLTAPVCRLWQSFDGLDPEFGFEKTATHLRMEGLLLGFWIAYPPLFLPAHWDWAKRSAARVMVISGIVFVAVQFLSPVWQYCVGFTALALALTSLLVFCVGRYPSRLASSSFVRSVAVASYSTYLTHALMIHLSRKVAGNISGIVGDLAYFPIALGLITAAGAGFYFGVERTSILMRDHWAPRRATPVAVKSDQSEQRERGESTQ